MVASGNNSESKSSVENPASQFPIALLKLEPKNAEFGTLPDQENVQTNVGPGVIDISPARNSTYPNATWFWPKALKIVKEFPPEDFKFPEGQVYRSAMTDKFANEGFFVTGVGLWGRTRNMYHWVEYDIPQGSTRFLADVLITDDPFGWMAGRVDKMNQQFTFFVFVDGKEVIHEGRTRTRLTQGSGEKLASLDIALPPGAQVIRFKLEVTPWGQGNKNIELVISEGMFQN